MTRAIIALTITALAVTTAAANWAIQQAVNSAVPSTGYLLDNSAGFLLDTANQNLLAR